MPELTATATVAIIGAGPAGLIAAEHLALAGHAVTLFDRMLSPGRKFLLAGRGGLNLTHSEPIAAFLQRYRPTHPTLLRAIEAFPPDHLRDWCEGLGQPVFTGSSGRVFPAAMKAAPLLRAWLRRLGALGVRLLPRHTWLGWLNDGALNFSSPQGAISFRPDATLLALGGGSWPRMGSDGAWTEILRAQGVQLSPLRPSNCGMTIAWSPRFLDRFEGKPLKRIALGFAGATTPGEVMVTAGGLEGGPIYALSGALRDALEAGPAHLRIDLRPDLAEAALTNRLAAPRRARSLANFLRQQAGLPPISIALLQEAIFHHGADPENLGATIKQLKLTVTGTAPIDRAISSAGGVRFDAIGEDYQLRACPGVFVAGEMLDWEAPTGGYLLQACFATGVAAAKAIGKTQGKRPGKVSHPPQTPNHS